MTKQRFTILYVEDNEPDFVLFEKMLEGIPDPIINLINAKNGEQTLNFLYKKEDYKTAPSPDIIILDINLPDMNGHEILKIIKNDQNLKLIPTIIFSTSDLEKDIKESYALYANSYITKTFDLQKLFKKITVMIEYWLKTSELPSTSNFCSLIQKNIETGIEPPLSQE